jgi:hypothetical protein
MASKSKRAAAISSSDTFKRFKIWALVGFVFKVITSLNIHLILSLQIISLKENPLKFRQHDPKDKLAKQMASVKSPNKKIEKRSLQHQPKRSHYHSRERLHIPIPKNSRKSH